MLFAFWFYIVHEVTSRSSVFRSFYFNISFGFFALTKHSLAVFQKPGHQNLVVFLLWVRLTYRVNQTPDNLNLEARMRIHERRLLKRTVNVRHSESQAPIGLMVRQVSFVPYFIGTGRREIAETNIQAPNTPTHNHQTNYRLINKSRPCLSRYGCRDYLSIAAIFYT